ncbi:DUF5681 domain-containing protein [Psychromarinibacter sp. S121]|uniref:DUF5681 domain-containing protein n=1 Tax=Psychromarinibacter sp. S121 TaxID=3415127 RepID=UPI003C7C3700
MSTDDEDGDERDYEVGYGKPPKHSRFKKGQSGNPRGRPKGAKGFKASLKRELATKVTVRDGNREMKISKAEAAAKRLMANALKGNMRALGMLASFDDEFSDEVAAAGVGDDGTLSPEAVDFEILREFLNRPSEPDADDDPSGDTDD